MDKQSFLILYLNSRLEVLVECHQHAFIELPEVVSAKFLFEAEQVGSCGSIECFTGEKSTLSLARPLRRLQLDVTFDVQEFVVCEQTVLPKERSRCTETRTCRRISVIDAAYDEKSEARGVANVFQEAKVS